MRVICTYGSVRGATGNRRPYRDALEESSRWLTTDRSWPIGDGSARAVVVRRLSTWAKLVIPNGTSGRRPDRAGTWLVAHVPRLLRLGSGARSVQGLGVLPLRCHTTRHMGLKRPSL